MEGREALVMFSHFLQVCQCETELLFSCYLELTGCFSEDVFFFVLVLQSLCINSDS